jgi:hypothetical protein
MNRIRYSEAQELLKRLIDEGDPDEVAMIFETFAKVKDGSARYISDTEEIVFEPDPALGHLDYFN